MSKQENNKDFETSLKKLEQIVSDLENGELPLEQSIKTFEEGVKLTTVSYTHLTLPTSHCV